jgi:hypothetical protein
LQKQFMRSQELFNVTGEYSSISRDSVYNDYDLSVVASNRMMNKQVRQNAIAQLSQIVSGNPNINQMEWLKLVLESYDFNPKKLLSGGGNQPVINQQGAPQAVMGANINQMLPQQPGEGGQGFDFIKGETVA